MQSSILLVDDQESIRHFLERAMSADGHEVRRHLWQGDRHANKAASAEAALRLVLERVVR